MIRSLLRLAVYLWPLPYTLLSITIGLLLAGRFRLVSGVIEIEGPRVARVLARLPVSPQAITVGHAVLGRDRRALRVTRIHERVHVRQYERWGPFFVPAYLAASLAMALTGRDPYRDNPFEREAFDYEAKAKQKLRQSSPKRS